VLKLQAELMPLTSKTPSDWVVYMLRCADGSLYTGITNDLLQRMKKHNAGTASRYTRSRLPVKLVYEERSENRSLATKRELAIKSLSRIAKEALIQAANSSIPRN
jgi:UV DNA damage endonuclease